MKLVLGLVNLWTRYRVIKKKKFSITHKRDLMNKCIALWANLLDFLVTHTQFMTCTKTQDLLSIRLIKWIFNQLEKKEVAEWDIMSNHIDIMGQFIKDILRITHTQLTLGILCRLVGQFTKDFLKLHIFCARDPLYPINETIYRRLSKNYTYSVDRIHGLVFSSSVLQLIVWIL